MEHYIGIKSLFACSYNSIRRLCLFEKYDERGKNAIGEIERFKFYEETKTAYAVIATSEKALYANIMLQKGVV